MKGTTVKRLRKDGTASYAGVFRAVDPKTGRTRQVWKSGFRTQKLAEDWVKTEVHKADKANGVYSKPTKDTVKQYLEQWIRAKRVSARPSTIAMYQTNIDAYILPALGDIELGRLTSAHISALYGDLLDHGRRRDGSGLSNRAVEIVHVVLRKSLADAVDAKPPLIPTNPADGAQRPKGQSPEAAAWSSEQVGAFLQSVKDDRLSALWRLYATTGLRRGEALALHWDGDIDLDKAKVSVSRNVALVNHQVVITEHPKTDSSRRTISIGPETVAALRAHKLRQKKERVAWEGSWPDSDLVFTREDGTVLHPEAMTKRFGTLSARTELPSLTLHGLRHSHATKLLREGTPIAVVSKRLGHKNVQVTLTIYAHALPGDDEAAAEQGEQFSAVSGE